MKGLKMLGNALVVSAKSAENSARERRWARGREPCMEIIVLFVKQFYLYKNKFEGCNLQPSQRELADKNKSWPNKKGMIEIHNSKIN